jgi:meso-butanediol dehydrogenase / (S,S)-butanediol dehydrogenase / diacetyl reductase
MTIATDRKAVVTGGASGFGLAVARKLSADGARVALVDLDQAKLDSTAADVGGGAIGIEADVRSRDAVQQAIERAATAFGGLDTLVVSAGVIHIKPIGEVTESDWDLTLDVNLKGAFLAIQAAKTHLAASGRGRVVAIASDAGKRGFPFTQAYCASKFGLVGLIESFAVEVAAEAVTANCVCPVGCYTTGMGQQVLQWKIQQVGKSADEIMAAAARTNPLGRNVSETDIVDAIMYFISEEGAFLTGVALDVDGGAHIGGLPGVD